MGLDMYLTRKVYIGRYNDKVEGTLKVHGPTYGRTNIKSEVAEYDLAGLCGLVYDAGYWRKANAIHKWFVDNIQGGVDECQESYVDREDLEKLLDLCKMAVKAVDEGGEEDGMVANGQKMVDGEWVDIMEKGKVYPGVQAAAKLLPTSSGFFFGSTDYDQWYVRDLKETVTILEAALKHDTGEFYYQASW